MALAGIPSGAPELALTTRIVGARSFRGELVDRGPRTVWTVPRCREGAWAQVPSRCQARNRRRQVSHRRPPPDLQIERGGGSRCDHCTTPRPARGEASSTHHHRAAASLGGHRRARRGVLPVAARPPGRRSAGSVPRGWTAGAGRDGGLSGTSDHQGSIPGNSGDRSARNHRAAVPASVRGHLRPDGSGRSQQLQRAPAHSHGFAVLHGHRLRHGRLRRHHRHQLKRPASSSPRK